MAERIGVLVRAESGPGVLHLLTGAIARHGGDIASVDIIQDGAGSGDTRVYFEIDLSGDPTPLVDDLRALSRVHEVALVNTLRKIYGKRVIIMGGGAQVGQVA